MRKREKTYIMDKEMKRVRGRKEEREKEKINVT